MRVKRLLSYPRVREDTGPAFQDKQGLSEQRSELGNCFKSLTPSLVFGEDLTLSQKNGTEFLDILDPASL